MKMRKFFKVFKPKAGKIMPDDRSDYEELELISKSLEEVPRKFSDKRLSKLAQNLEYFISEVNKSFSNSWLGYHSCIYYKDLQPPPPGEFFDSLQIPLFDFRYRSGNWFTYEPNDIREFILKQCGISDTGNLQDYGKGVRKKFNDCKAEVISIRSIETYGSDPFIVDNIKKIQELVPISVPDIIRFCRPKSLELIS